MKTFCAQCRWILLSRDLGHFILTHVSFLYNIIAPNLMGHNVTLSLFEMSSQANVSVCLLRL
jgi:hypothetical protein